MRKSTIIVVVIAVIVVLVVVVALLFGRSSPGTTGTGGSTGTGTLPPVASPTPLVTPSGSTFVIGTNQGQVTVNNFYENPDYVTTDNQTVVLTENATYTIVYNVSDSSFIISLLSTPLPAARTAAESAFLQQLGITESDACKLNVDEGVPISVSDQYPGEDLGLSFCPGAVGL